MEKGIRRDNPLLGRIEGPLGAWLPACLPSLLWERLSLVSYVRNTRRLRLQYTVLYEYKTPVRTWHTYYVRAPFLSMDNLSDMYIGNLATAMLWQTLTFSILNGSLVLYFFLLWWWTKLLLAFPSHVSSSHLRSNGSQYFSCSRKNGWTEKKKVSGR